MQITGRLHARKYAGRKNSHMDFPRDFGRYMPAIVAREKG
jgi:hypothetical protein